MSRASTVTEQIALKQISEDTYTTLFNPDKMGNAANIAYGGCALATGVNAAFQTVEPGYHCYSVLGNYLGPTMNDRKLYAKIRRIRDTRTFASRQVELSQEYPDGRQGKHRSCMIMFVEFQRQEPGSLLTYSAPQTREYPPPEECKSRYEMEEQLIKSGKVPKKMVEVFRSVFGLMARFYEGCVIPGTAMAENLYGLAKHIPTSQDSLPLTQKYTAEWVRSRSELKTEAENVSSLSFYMDGALSFIPLSFNHLFLQDAAACSSLDFALRIFSNRVDFNQWHVKEMKTITGAEGRTYSEGQLWDRGGNMVASMTQQSVLRPHPPKKAVL